MPVSVDAGGIHDAVTRHYGCPGTSMDGLLLHGMEEAKGSIPP